MQSAVSQQAIDALNNAANKFQELHRFAKNKIEQAHKKEIMYVDFYDASGGSQTASNASAGAEQ